MIVTVMANGERRRWIARFAPIAAVRSRPVESSDGALRPRRDRRRFTRLLFCYVFLFYYFNFFLFNKTLHNVRRFAPGTRVRQM